MRPDGDAPSDCQMPSAYPRGQNCRHAGWLGEHYSCLKSNLRYDHSLKFPSAVSKSSTSGCKCSFVDFLLTGNGENNLSSVASMQQELWHARSPAASLFSRGKERYQGRHLATRTAALQATSKPLSPQLKDPAIVVGLLNEQRLVVNLAFSGSHSLKATDVSGFLHPK